MIGFHLKVGRIMSLIYIYYGIQETGSMPRYTLIINRNEF